MTDAEKELIAKVNIGDENAFYNLGEYYYSVSRYEDAFSCYIEETKSKNPEINAYFNIAYAYQFGIGTEVDMVKAFDYYEEASRHKLPHAMQNLAYFYHNGIVVKRDHGKAEELCREAMNIFISSQKEMSKLCKEHSKLIYNHNIVKSENAELTKKLNLLREESQKKTAKLNEMLTQSNDLIEKQKLKLSENSTLIAEQTEKIAKYEAKTEDQKKRIIQLENMNKKTNSIISNKTAQISALNKELFNKKSKINKQAEDISILEKQKPFMKKNIAIWISNIFTFLLLLTLYINSKNPDTPIVFMLSVFFIVLTLIGLCIKGKLKTVFFIIGNSGKVLSMFYYGWIDKELSDLKLQILIFTYIFHILQEILICIQKEVIVAKKDDCFFVEITGRGKWLKNIIVILTIAGMLFVSFYITYPIPGRLS